MTRPAHIVALIATLCLLLLTGCAKNDGEILTTVPADASSVLICNLDSTARQLGLQSQDGELHLPASWQLKGDEEETESALTLLTTLSKAIDCSEIVVFTTPDNSVSTFKIVDSDMLMETLGDSYESNGGYDIYNIGNGTTLMIDDQQGWIIDSDDTSLLKKLLQRAESEECGSIAGLKGVAEALSANAPMRMAINVDQLTGSEGDRWIVGATHIETRAISSEIRFIKSDGTAVEIPGLQPTDTDILKYLPHDASFIATVGATTDTDWTLAKRVFESISDPQLNGLLGTILPYLEKSDGTVAIATNLNFDDLEASGSSFLLMLHTPQAQTDAALREIRQRITSMGMTPQRISDSMIGIPGLYAGNVDGYLTVCSRPLSAKESPHLTAYFNGQQMAALLKVPRLQQLNINSPSQLHFQLHPDGAVIKITSSAPIADLLGPVLSLSL